MNLLQKVLADSFIILSRNFTLIYPVLFFYLLLPLIAPQEVTPAWEPKWILLFAILLLIAYAFMAGGFYMIYKACRYYVLFVKPREERERRQAQNTDGDTFVPAPPPAGPDDPRAAEVLNSFLILKEFFPGIGIHFPAFALGGFITVAATLLIGLLVQQGIEQVLGGPPAFLDDLAKLQTQAQIEQYVYSLPLAQQMAFSQSALLILSGVVGSGVFFLLTMFWPIFVVLQRASVLRAYGKSVRQFFMDPLRVLFIGGAFLAFNFLLALLLGAQSGILLSLFQFLHIILMIYFVIVLFMYVIYANALPLTEEETEIQDKASPAGTTSG